MISVATALEKVDDIWEVLELIHCDLIVSCSVVGNTGKCFECQGKGKCTELLSTQQLSHGGKNRKWTWDEIELWELRWKGRKDGGVYTYRIVRVLRGMRGRFMKKENMRRMPSIYKE